MSILFDKEYVSVIQCKSCCSNPKQRRVSLIKPNQDPIRAVRDRIEPLTPNKREREGRANNCPDSQNPKLYFNVFSLRNMQF